MYAAVMLREKGNRRIDKSLLREGILASVVVSVGLLGDTRKEQVRKLKQLAEVPVGSISSVTESEVLP